MEKTKPLDRRGLILGGSGLLIPSLAFGQPEPSNKADPFSLSGKLVQGGYAIGKAGPKKEVILDGVSRGFTSSAGFFFIGFDRDSGGTARLEIKGEGKSEITIAPTQYDIQRIDGLPPSFVSPTDPKILARIASDKKIKNIGFSSREDADWFKDGFAYPLKSFRVSGRFGNQRILNGEPKSPHYGFDMAAPTGTKVYAPQAARVALAEPNLYFEGGLILLDHGQGLISMYLHLSALKVKTGQLLQKGDIIGLVGAKGRATGPHLCWRLKWRDRALDPSLMVR
jgi:murein DD-endopeptidase MepM/ murein hydrolase activator NlpD